MSGLPNAIQDFLERSTIQLQQEIRQKTLGINGRELLGQRREYPRDAFSQQEIRRPYSFLFASLLSTTYPCSLCHFSSRSIRRLLSILRVGSSVQRNNQLPSAEIHPGIFGHLFAASRRPVPLLLLLRRLGGILLLPPSHLRILRLRHFIDFASLVPVSLWLGCALSSTCPAEKATARIALRAMAGGSRGRCWTTWELAQGDWYFVVVFLFVWLSSQLEPVLVAVVCDVQGACCHRKPMRADEETVSIHPKTR